MHRSLTPPGAVVSEQEDWAGILGLAGEPVSRTTPTAILRRACEEQGLNPASFSSFSSFSSF
jgi:hypothetical protein